MRRRARSLGFVPGLARRKNFQLVEFQLLQRRLGQRHMGHMRRVESAAKDPDTLCYLRQTQSRRGRKSV